MALSPEERLAALTADHQAAIYRMLTEAEADLNRRLYAAVDSGAVGTARKLKAIQREIQQELMVLDGTVKSWANQSTREVYLGSLAVTDAQVGRAIGASIKAAIGWDAPIHVDALDLLAQAAYTPFGSYLGNIGRRVDDDFRQAALTQARSALLGIQTQGGMERALRGTLAAQGHFDFTDSTGRVWGLKRYTTMVSRTVLREAETQGSANRMVQMGLTLGEVSFDADPCGRCVEWQGKILDLNGSSGGQYPTLDDAKAGGLWHPNCRHNVLPHVPDVDAMMANMEQYLGDKPSGKPPAAPTGPVPGGNLDPMAAIKAEADKLHGMADPSPEAVRISQELKAARDADNALRLSSQSRLNEVHQYRRQVAQWERGLANPKGEGIPDYMVPDLPNMIEESKRRLAEAEKAYQDVLDRIDATSKKAQDLAQQLKTVGTDWAGSEVQARRLGSMIRSEVEKQTAPITERIKALEAERKAANEAADAIRNDPEVQGLLKALQDVKPPDYNAASDLADWQKYQKARDAAAKAYSDALERKGLLTAQERAKEAGRAIAAAEKERSAGYFDVLAKIRDFGSGADVVFDATARDVQQIVKDTVAKVFPKSWWKSAGQVRYSVIRGRAFYRESERWCRINLGGGAAVHETTHFMEYRIPGLYDLVEAFYNRRCTLPDGTLEPVLKLSKITGVRSYGAREVARKDNWPQAYMGKVYPDRAHEVITCAFDDLAAGKASWITDPDQADLLDFCLGILAGVG